MSLDGSERGLQIALARAALADDRELASRLREEGLRLVVSLTHLISAARLNQGDDPLDAPAAEAAQVVRSLVDRFGAIHLTCADQQIYVNDIRLQPSASEQATAAELVQELNRHETSGLSFHAAIDADDTKRVARAITLPAVPAGLGRSRLAERLAKIDAVEVSGRYPLPVESEATPARLEHADVLRRSEVVAGEALDHLARGRLPNPVPVRRVVIDLIDSFRGRPDRAAAAPFRRGSLGAGERHLVSVTSLAIQLGQSLGLPDDALSDLGVAAMLHDVGYVRIAEAADHAAEGARILMRQRGFHEGKVRRLHAVFDHHRPHVPADDDSRPGLFARILRIADDYDLLTAPRSDLPLIPPPTAQASMWAARGTVYDPDLLALFAQVMGLYPPGSLLELSDNRLVIVESGGRDRDRFAWPVVRTVRDAESKSTDTTVGVDLFDTRDTLRPRRVANPSRQGIDITELMERIFGGS